MTCILGIAGRRDLALLLVAGLPLVVAACSTDLDYLRAGRTTGGGTGSGDPTGTGGGGQAGSVPDDAGDGDSPDGDDAGADSGDHDGSADSNDGSIDKDGASDAQDAPRDAREGGAPRPTGITLGLPYATMQQAPSAGGSNYTDPCPPDRVAIGFNGTVDAPGTAYTYPRSIQLVCGLLSITTTEPYQVKTSFAATLPARGFPGAVAQNRLCPPDQVVVGFDVRAGMYIDQLTFRCAPLMIVGGQQYTLSIGTAVSVAPIGGPGGESFPQINCAAGGIATGSIVRAGTAIDAFGLACANPSLAPAFRSRPVSCQEGDGKDPEWSEEGLHGAKGRE